MAQAWRAAASGSSPPLHQGSCHALLGCRSHVGLAVLLAAHALYTKEAGVPAAWSTSRAALLCGRCECSVPELELPVQATAMQARSSDVWSAHDQGCA